MLDFAIVYVLLSSGFCAKQGWSSVGTTIQDETRSYNHCINIWYFINKTSNTLSTWTLCLWHKKNSH